MSREPAISYSRLAGAALGAMCGDALGMPVEGWSAVRITAEYGRLKVILPGRLEADGGPGLEPWARRLIRERRALQMGVLSAIYTDDEAAIMAPIFSLQAWGGISSHDRANRRDSAS